MQILNDKNDFWLNLDGLKVTIEGHTHVLKVRTHKAIYPYAHTALYVDAEMCDKNHEDYLSIKRQLRDDWTTDILSSPELESEVLSQIFSPVA